MCWYCLCLWWFWFFRLAGVTLVAPVVNYWWKSFPSDLSTEAYYQQARNDQWAVRVAHYAPWLTHWWNTQKWFPGSSVVARNLGMLSKSDKEIMFKLGAARRKHEVYIYITTIHHHLFFYFTYLHSSNLSYYIGTSKATRNTRDIAPWHDCWIWNLGIWSYGTRESVPEQWRIGALVARRWWCACPCDSATLHCTEAAMDTLPWDSWSRTFVPVRSRYG